MNVLLDTHVLIWLDMDSSRLSQTVVNYLTDPSNRLLLSAASVWEIAIKMQLGKLTLTDTLEAVLAQQIAINGFHMLDVTAAHGMTAGFLPRLHKDPFDRLLIAQAIIEDAVLLTDDGLITQYGYLGVRTDW